MRPLLLCSTFHQLQGSPASLLKFFEYMVLLLLVSGLLQQSGRKIAHRFWISRES